MKKLNFKLGGIGEMLTKDQMKKVVGGYGDCFDECSIEPCPTGQTCTTVACGGQTTYQMCV